jgi:transposase
VRRDEIDALHAQGADAVAVVIARLEAQVAELRVQVAELQARLGQNPRNSSRPPSSEGYSKPPPDRKRSLRRSSGRRPGGQPGAEGHHLQRVDDPDEQIQHPPERCEACAVDLADSEPVPGGERRQLFDLPEEIVLRVIEQSPPGAVAVAAVTSAPVVSPPGSARPRSTGRGCARWGSTWSSSSICPTSAPPRCWSTSPVPTSPRER